MKKIIKIFILTLCLSLLALPLVGCGNNTEFDPTYLLNRIEELERQLDEARELQGLPGPPGQQGQQGLTPHIGDNGNWWIGSTDTGVRAVGQDGNAGQSPHIGNNGNWWVGSTDTGVSAQVGQTLNRIYQLGQTFTFINHGLELFSIRVVRAGANPTGISVTITNINMPGYAPSGFVRMRAQSSPGADTFATYNFSNTLLPIGGLPHTQGFDLFNVGITQVYFGFPLAGDLMIPYAIFQVQ